MRYIVILLAVFLIGWSWGDTYRKGYEQGSVYNPNGIKYIPKIAPIPPLPRLGETTQEDAYIKGMLDGINDRQKKKYWWNK